MATSPGRQRRGAIVERDDPDPPSVLSSPAVLLAVVVRWDRPDVLARAIHRVPREFSIVGPAEAADAIAGIVPRRDREHAVLYHLPPAMARRLPASPIARLLRDDEYRQLDNLPPILRGELRDACNYSPIAAAFVDDRPVSFCYSGWETETHWDVSIDTLDGYRRRGLATAASTCLLHHFANAGKTAVWGAVDSNTESGALARKLGFTPVDELMVVYPDDGH